MSRATAPLSDLMQPCEQLFTQEKKILGSTYSFSCPPPSNRDTAVERNERSDTTHAAEKGTSSTAKSTIVCSCIRNNAPNLLLLSKWSQIPCSQLRFSLWATVENFAGCVVVDLRRSAKRWSPTQSSYTRTPKYIRRTSQQLLRAKSAVASTGFETILKEEAGWEHCFEYMSKQ